MGVNEYRQKTVGDNEYRQKAARILKLKHFRDQNFIKAHLIFEKYSFQLFYFKHSIHFLSSGTSGPLRETIFR